MAKGIQQIALDIADELQVAPPPPDPVQVMQQMVRNLEVRVFGLEQVANPQSMNGSNEPEEEEMPVRDVLESYYPVTAKFTGTAYVMGVKITGLLSDPNKPWVKCVRSTQTAVEVVAAPASPFPDDEEYYEKLNTFGDIHAFSH